MAARQRFRGNGGRTRSTHEGGVCQDDLRLVGEDVELDDVAVAVPVDDLRVCVGQTEQRRQGGAEPRPPSVKPQSLPRAAKVPFQTSFLCPTAPSAPLCITLMLSC